MTVDEPTTIRQLFNNGIISINVYTYFRYYIVFDAYVKKGITRNQAYEYASDECGCSRRTIERAVKKVESL